MIEGIQYSFSQKNPACLIISDGERTRELSEDETQLFFQYSKRNLQNAFQYHGINLKIKKTTETPDAESLIAAHCKQIRSDLPENLSLVMLDSQTITNADECLNGDITPLNLLDLATLTVAAVYFDKIVIQPQNNNSIVNKNPDLFVILKYPDNFIEDSLWIMLDTQYLSAEKYGETWCKFLNLPKGDVNVDLYAYKDNYQNSPLYWDGILASYYVEKIGQNAMISGGDKASRDEFLSIQTMRVIFNDRLSGFLGIPYLSSSIKSCIHSTIIRKKMETQIIIDRLITEIQSDVEDNKTDSPYLTEYSAPFLLGLLLEKMDTPNDYWKVMFEYREKFSPLRKKILADRENWKGKSGQYLKGYQKYINEFSKSISKNESKSVKISTTVCSTLSVITPPELRIIGLGIKIFEMLNPGKIALRYYLEWFKPEVYLLVNLADEASQLEAVESKISEIWNKSWTRKDHDQLVFFSKSNPYDFLKLTKVD